MSVTCHRKNLTSGSIKETVNDKHTKIVLIWWCQSIRISYLNLQSIKEFNLKKTLKKTMNGFVIVHEKVSNEK